MNNCLFVGSHHEEVITLDGFELRMAYGSDIYESRELFIDLMKKTLGEVKGIFGESSANQYLIVINRHKMTDGSAFRSSFSEIINGEVSEASRVTWGHTMLHETVHLWNGLTLIPTGQEEWFKEGFTDYLTMELESRTVINTPEIVLKRMEKMYSRYIIGKFIQRAPESLQEAGNRKQEIRSLVYGGGALFALALDIELREATNNAVGVDDLMRSLFTEFALKGKTYTSQDILKMTSQLSGENFDEFFQTFLYNNGYTDFSEYFERIGINAYSFAEEIYLSPNEKATAQQKAIRKSIFGW